MRIQLSKIRLEVPEPEQAGHGRATTRRAMKKLLSIPELAIASGEKILIQGPSGTGKSTLLHLIAGLHMPAEGTLEWNDSRVNSMNDEERSHFRKKHFAIVFQRLNLLEHLTAGENIELALDHKLSAKEKAERIASALKQVGLGDRASSRSQVLSLGEQQRVAIARVLAQKPQVILADEPTSSLDQKNAERSLESLMTAAKNATLIVVSHDARIAKQFQKVIQITDWKA